jgi:outer membrane murein-binding lipoprotein Lpp
MWNKNKDTIKWIAGLIGSALIAWGVAKTKIDYLQKDVDLLKSSNSSLQIELAKTQVELKDLKEDNKQEHRDIKRQIKGH